MLTLRLAITYLLLNIFFRVESHLHSGLCGCSYTNEGGANWFAESAFLLNSLALDCASASCRQQLLMFDAQDAKFRSIKLRPRKADCTVCGEKPTVTQLLDYEAFCGSAASDKVGGET